MLASSHRYRETWRRTSIGRCVSIDIDRRLFARTFYASLRSYAESLLFDFTRWAAIPMQEDLARRGFAIAAADLATFSGPALRAKLYPAYLDHPATGATQSIVQGYKRVEGEVVDSPDPHRTPFHLFQDRIRIRRLGSFTARRLYRRTVA